jgi:hypothetical protein
MTYTLIVAIPVVALLATLVLWRLRPRTLPLLITATLLAATYAVANVMIASDYEDADGFMDCWPYCSGVQDAVKVAFWLGGGTLVVIGAVSLAWAAFTFARRRREPSSAA